MLNPLPPAGSPAYDDIETALRRAEASTDAAEAHGSLCGLVCGLGASGQSAWRAETLADAPPDASVTHQAGSLLDELAASTRAGLEDGSMAFEPLLPPDGEPLVERVDALAQWCQGFNYGLTMAARVGDAEAEVNSGTIVEIVRDFSEMAQVSVGDDEADDAGEAAYAELVEYLRVSVQLVYEELTPVRQRMQATGLH